MLTVEAPESRFKDLNEFYYWYIDAPAFESHSDKECHFRGFCVLIHKNHFQTNVQTLLFSFPALNKPITQQLIHLFDLYFANLLLQHYQESLVLHHLI